MYSKAAVRGHPLHPMFVAFPITFYTVTLIAFAVYQWFIQDLFWYRLALFCNYAGVATAVLAAIPGFIDWSVGIPRETAAKRRGLRHMTLNVIALILFGLSAYTVWGTWDAPPEQVGTPLWLALVGVVLTMAAGYHGWELIATHKVGVRMTPEQERLEPIGEMSPEAHERSLKPRTV
ncbi:MAG: DUF2231 domain-containing protein [Bdellovibrionaceae bacterium]|nr:DUF2231 domain-containing protein [Pseudobdellovibrionaceae bacterium]